MKHTIAPGQPGAEDQAVAWHLDSCHGLDCLKAVFRWHAFPRHFHETYVIELVQAGADEFYCAGQTHRAGAGCLVLINPGEVHTGKSVGPQPLRYRSFYPRPELLTELATDLGWRGSGFPPFAERVMRVPQLAAEMGRLHQALEQPASDLEAETRCLAFLGRLLAAEGFGGRAAPPVGDASALGRVQEYLRGHLAGRPTLAELAALTPWRPYHFLHVFTRTLGLPPHEYLLSVRIERAKQLLRHGAVAEVAQRTGFADQSHLTRCFKRRVGLPPGQFSRRKIVQDRSARSS